MSDPSRARAAMGECGTYGVKGRGDGVPACDNIRPFVTPTVQLARGRQLRREQTDAERRLWSRLRRKGLCGLKVRRQQPIGPYIVDFYVATAKLVIELDGAQHGEPDAVGYDRARDESLEGLGLRVLRIDNHHALHHTDEVLLMLAELVSDGPSP